jgi:hypothetical protein
MNEVCMGLFSVGCMLHRNIVVCLYLHIEDCQSFALFSFHPEVGCFVDVEMSLEFLYFFHTLGPNHECIICVLHQ